MATHSVAVAKAALIAPFIRADPVSTSREKLAEFHEYLDKVLNRCFHNDIQDCRGWLTREGQSANRVTAVAKYLGVLSASFSVGAEEKAIAGQSTGRRKRLHILYLINDWLHHVHYHPDTFVSPETVREALRSHLVNLVSLASACDLDKHKKIQRRMTILLDQWQRQRYYEEDFIDKLRQATLHAVRESEGQDEEAGSHGNVEKSMPFILPAQHGEPTTPWYDLPAGNMLPLITPNSAFPIDAEMMKPLRFHSGPADSSLVALVKDLLRDSDIIYGDDEPVLDGMELDYDELGQKMFRGKDDKDTVYGDTYYGWSKEFCERMKQRQKEGLPVDDHRRGKDRSLSRGRRDSSYSRSRSRSRSRSESDDRRPQIRRPSRSPSPGSHKRSRNNSAHMIPRGQRGQNFRPQQGRNQEQSYSPPSSLPTGPPPPPPPQMGTPQWPYHTPGPPPLLPHGVPIHPVPMPIPMPMPMPMQHMAPHPQQHPGHWQGGPPGHAGIPAPPPRPPNWQGPWPPPPPPPLPGMQGGYGQFPHPPPPTGPPGPPPPQYMGGWGGGRGR